MGKAIMLHLVFGVLAVLGVSLVNAEDPYLYYTWTVTNGTRSNLGVPQQVILINNQFPGPKLDVVTNSTIILNVINKLDQPLSLTWNNIKQGKNYGTNCPIPPNSNFTYKFQAKDQIGSYTYFPSSPMHRAAGGFGALSIYRRSLTPRTGPKTGPGKDFILQILTDSGLEIFQQAMNLIDGDRTNNQDHPTVPTITGEQGKTYQFVLTNVGLSTPLIFWIKGHKMQIVQGSYVISYDSAVVPVNQNLPVFVTFNQPPNDYPIFASARYIEPSTTLIAMLHYIPSQPQVSGAFSSIPAFKFDWSFSFCMVLYLLLLNVNYPVQCK